MQLEPIDLGGKLSDDDLVNLSLEELAVVFGCSSRQLNRVFRERFGCSVVAWRMEMRLLKAASRLRDSEGDIRAIARECGFGSLGLFKTCFQRRFGVTAEEARRNLNAKGL
jgi:transcriptional regulator GlxA family with amidase domain